MALYHGHLLDAFFVRPLYKVGIMCLVKGIHTPTCKLRSTFIPTRRADDP
jgi:hypothetical protein